MPCHILASLVSSALCQSSLARDPSMDPSKHGVPFIGETMLLSASGPLL